VGTSYERFVSDEGGELAAFLCGEVWPFHSGGPEEREAVLARVAAGYYDDESTQTYWVVVDGTRVGLLVLEDLGDDTPMFDLRFRAAHRGQGHGTGAVRWLTERLFTTLPDIGRIEAVTRQDNLAMRRVLARCGYAKESHYRNAWPAPDGKIHDSVGYAIIRKDWQTGEVTTPNWNDDPPT
jgi:RimJ/RimL family protein N-acetyltransferase